MKNWILLLFFAAISAFSGGLEKVDNRIHQAFSELATKKGEDREGVRIIVQLKSEDRADFQRGAEAARVAEDVYGSQSSFLQELEQNDLLANDSFADGRSGFRPELLLDYQYALAGYVSDGATLARIAALDSVAAVELDQLNELFTVEGRNITGSAAVANTGIRGQGIGIAIIDTNFDLLHPELGGNTTLPNGVVFGGRNLSANNNQIHSRVQNDCYHGTGTASIARRYAQDSDLYALVVFPNAFDSVIASAIDWCITNRNGVNGGDPIRIISMSLGGGQYSGNCNTGVIHTAAGNARTNGIVLLAATGNNGWTSATASPSCSSNIISIGATWDANNAPYTPFPPANCSDNNRVVNERTCYSNTSWATNLYAPSEEVICARCGGGTQAFGGTSAATPAAAGMVAQLMSAQASFIGNHQGIIDLFTNTGVAVSGEFYPRRRIDIASAISSCAVVPARPSYISGPNYDPCPNSTIVYQVPAVPNTDHYEWEVVGTPIWDSTSSPSIYLSTHALTPGASYSLRVRAVNCAGASAWRSATIFVLNWNDPQCSGCSGRMCDLPD